jgi:hypothetical protein
MHLADGADLLIVKVQYQENDFVLHDALVV